MGSGCCLHSSPAACACPCPWHLSSSSRHPSVCPLMKDVTQRWAEGTYFPFHFQERRRGGLFPSRGVCGPKEEKEGCCHGGLCEANSSRVKWEIFIPGVRQRAAARGQGTGAHVLRTQRGLVCGQVGLGRVLAVRSLSVYLSVHLGVVRPPAPSARVVMGNLGPVVGRSRPAGDPCDLCMSHPCPCCRVTPIV